MVSITADDYGRFGRVTEMLPAGFTYVSVSGDLEEDDVNNDTEGEVRFTLQGRGPISFTYTVTASSVERSHDFLWCAEGLLIAVTTTSAALAG